MRRRFNKGKYYERMLSGALTLRINKDRVPPFPEANEPLGTHSQEFSYFDGGQEVVRGHQYIRPDGTFGASGLPDPKRIFEDGVWYRLRHPPKNWRERILYQLSDWRDRLYWLLNLEVD